MHVACLLFILMNTNSLHRNILSKFHRGTFFSVINKRGLSIRISPHRRFSSNSDIEKETLVNQIKQKGLHTYVYLV